jgi:pimeloyl-ACP methyl ester carboxylesterase
MKRNIAVVIVFASVAGALTGCVPPSWGANALLHPPRRPLLRHASAPFEEVDLVGAGVTLKGWRLPATGPKRGTLIYLHGIADNRMSGTGVAERFAQKGFDVVAYDSRAHGESGGDACTYGYHEKSDLIRVLEMIDTRPVVLFGVSLGAAVALQATAVTDRVAAVVAAEVFSDLSTVVRERAPVFLTERNIQKALVLAERQAAFQVRDVSPVAAAARIHVPVLLIHGARDRHTPPDHSRRVFDALRGPKRLILVPEAGHNESLKGSVWREIEEWLDGVLPTRAPPG